MLNLQAPDDGYIFCPMHLKIQHISKEPLFTGSLEQPIRRLIQRLQMYITIYIYISMYIYIYICVYIYIYGTLPNRVAGIMACVGPILRWAAVGHVGPCWPAPCWPSVGLPTRRKTSVRTEPSPPKPDTPESKSGLDYQDMSAAVCKFL